MFDRGSASESISTGRREPEHTREDDGRGSSGGKGGEEREKTEKSNEKKNRAKRKRENE